MTSYVSCLWTNTLDIVEYHNHFLFFFSRKGRRNTMTSYVILNLRPFYSVKNLFWIVLLDIDNQVLNSASCQ